MYKSFALAVFGCVTVLLIGTAAIAQVESTPIPLPAKPDFSSMSFLVGTWKCSETNTRRATAYTSTFTTSMDPSGYWMDTKTVSDPAPFDPTASTSNDKMTYDGGTSKWVDVSTDDRGNYGITTSTGWTASKLVWHPVSFTSVSSGNVVSGGDTTLTKVSGTKYSYTGSFKESGGRTITLKGTCTKT